MKLARILLDGQATVARLIGDELEPVLTETNTLGKTWLQWSSEDAARAPVAGNRVPVAQATFLPAMRPRNIFAIGLNYYQHAVESQFDIPTEPLLFSKTNNTITSHGSTIWCPSDVTEQPDFEAELAVVIGRDTLRVAEQDAINHVFAYTVSNDVSARDMQFSDGQWTRGKSMDTFCPIGPFLTLADAVPDVMNLGISARLNGEVMQTDRTSSMIFDVPYLISYISRFITLGAGDIILTGTPEGVGFAREPAVFLKDGDRVEVEIEQLGSLSNVVSTSPALLGLDIAQEAAGKLM